MEQKSFNRSALLTVWLAYVASIAVFASLIYFLPENQGDPLVLPTMQLSITVMAVLSALASFIVPGVLEASFKRTQSRDHLIRSKMDPQNLLQPFILRLTFAEMPAVFGVALHQMGDNTQYPLVFPLISLVLFFLSFPSESWYNSKIKTTHGR